MNLLNTSLDFIRHRFSSKTRHGVHSPFVYSLIDKCVYSSNPKPAKELIRLFDKMKSSDRLLTGMDYGQKQETSVSVSHYAKRSSMPDFQVRLLHRLVSYFKPDSILELGTNLGKSLAAMASANPESKAVGVEGNASIAQFANENLKELGLVNAKVECDTFDTFLEKNQNSYDLIFLDGDHHYEPTMRYFKAIKEVLNDGGVIVLHDLYYSEGMKQAWAEIKKDRNVTITIDLFFFGLVWIDKSQAKENFSIQFPSSLFSVFF